MTKDAPTGRRALILPILPGLKPGLDVYEEAVFPLRCPEIDVYGLTIPFGPIPEDSLSIYGELLDFVIQDREVVEDEGAIRTRAWLDEMGPLYDRIVLLSYAPMITLRPWSRAIQWSKEGAKTRIVKLPKRNRITDRVIRNQLRRALGLKKEVVASAPWDAGSPFEDVFDQSDDELLDHDDGDLLGEEPEASDEEDGGGGGWNEEGEEGGVGILEAIGRAVPGRPRRNDR
jgi:hypothetical protein